jgi:hypothetical protein
MRLDLHQDTTAPREVVWDVLVDWEQQPRWMLDAKEVHVTSRTARGSASSCAARRTCSASRCRTRCGSRAGRSCATSRSPTPGASSPGPGAFELTSLADGGTRIGWWEEVDPPLGAVGELGARVFALPIIRRIFRRSLRNLARRAEEVHRAR